MNFEDLSPELQEKVKACKTAEELFALAKEEGVELTEDQLETIAGGQDYDPCFGNLPCNGNKS